MLTAAAILLAVPLALVGALWAGQERLIFLPDARPLAAPAGWQRQVLRTADGLDLAFLTAEGRADRPVMLHFHGNGGNAGDRTGLGNILNNAGYSVVLAEYRAYGGNPGRVGEEGFARDASAYLAWVQASHPGRPLVLWGESLGTGVVVRLAEGRTDLAGLVLESPFTSVADLARASFPLLPTGLLLRHPFENLARMPRVAAPVLVIASEADRITPESHARRIAEAAPDRRLVILPGGAHPAVLNDPGDHAVRQVLAFLRERIR